MSHMSLKEVYADHSSSTIENKFELIPQASTADTTTFVGRYPLEPYRDDTRGTYGGESVTQGVAAAWKTVSDKELSPHSLHAYFVRAGSSEMPVTWEVTKITDGKNYANRLVKGLQRGKIIFTIQVSFTRRNSKHERASDGRATIDFTTKPSYLLTKYRHQLDKLPELRHTHDLIHHRIPYETMNGSGVISSVEAIPETISYETTGNRTLGFFIKLNDSLLKAKDRDYVKVLQLCYASDASYLGTMSAALGVDINHWPQKGTTLPYFRVSLDHAMYFHDTDYSTDDWLYFEYRFPRFANDRVLCYVSMYTLDGRLICTTVQEALAYFDKDIKGRFDDLNGKL